MKKVVLMGILVAATMSMSFAETINVNSEKSKISRGVVESLHSPDFIKGCKKGTKSIVEFTIADNGKVNFVEAIGNDSKLNDYLESQIKKMRFRRELIDTNEVYKIKYSYNGTIFF